MSDPYNIAKRLTKAQKSALVGLSDEPCILGCSEPFVIRLCKQRHGRPPLAIEGSRLKHRTFALSKLGKAVKEVLTAECDYCGTSSLPGGACENCMNTGLKYPELSL